MLKPIFEKLDRWIEEENKQANVEGLPALKKCEFHIVGQNALIEAKLDLFVTATTDVDSIDNASHAIRSRLNELLKVEGLELDPLGSEIWMPKETQYSTIYEGTWVKAYLADPLYIFVSKAKFARKKDLVLLQEFIAKAADYEFFRLCATYQIDLEKILEN